MAAEPDTITSEEYQVRLYLDVCCLNRPYDDMGIDRNRLEAEAVVAVLRRIGRGEYTLVSSEVIDRELAACHDVEKAELVRQALSLAEDHVVLSPADVVRAVSLARSGLMKLDAMHVVCAETARCDWLLTTDDRMLKRAAAHYPRLRVRVANPLAFVTEIEP